jgi:hypothetical protein
LLAWLRIPVQPFGFYINVGWVPEACMKGVFLHPHACVYLSLSFEASQHITQCLELFCGAQSSLTVQDPCHDATDAFMSNSGHHIHAVGAAGQHLSGTVSAMLLALNPRLCANDCASPAVHEKRA